MTSPVNGSEVKRVTYGVKEARPAHSKKDLGFSSRARWILRQCTVAFNSFVQLAMNSDLTVYRLLRVNVFREKSSDY